MSEQAFTPGPWIISSILPTLVVQDLGDDIVRNVASAHVARGAFVDSDEWREGEANARLIAAAPDLLAACQPSDLDDAADIVEAENGFLARDLRKIAAAQRAAIAKAEGRAP